VKTGDYNGDGKADIVMRHVDGTVIVYLMNGTAIASGARVLGPGSWAVVP
jgi:hypothetical protein